MARGLNFQSAATPTLKMELTLPGPDNDRPTHKHYGIMKL